MILYDFTLVLYCFNMTFGGVAGCSDGGERVNLPDTALMTLVCAFASADCTRFQPFGAFFTSAPTPQAVDSAKASNIHTPASPPP